MSYAMNNKRNVAGSIAAVIVIVAIAIWQFYQFATFKDVNGGSIHLWLAIAMTVFACISGFLVFSIFLRHDTEDELHITSPPRPKGA